MAASTSPSGIGGRFVRREAERTQPGDERRAGMVETAGRVWAVDQEGLPSDLRDMAEVGRSASGRTVVLRRRAGLRLRDPSTWLSKARRDAPADGSEIVMLRAVDLRPPDDGFVPERGVRQGAQGGGGARAYLGELFGDDPNPKLNGRQGVRTWHTLRHTEPMVFSTYLALSLPILSADWGFVKDQRGEVPQEAVDWLNSRFGMGGFPGEMSISGQKFLTDAMKCLLYGMSPFEAVPFVAADGLLGLDMEWRHPVTVRSFVVRDEVLTKMRQDDTRRVGGSGTLDIDADRLCVFVNDREGHNWWGRSVFRGAYRAITMKNEYWYDQSVLIDRFGAGIPMAKWDPESWDRMSKDRQESALERMDTLLEDLRNGEQAFVNPPPGVTVEVFGGRDGEGPDIIKAIDRCDFEVQVAGMSQDLGLGRTERGVRAIGEHFGDMRGVSILAMADEIAGTIIGPPAPGCSSATKLLRSEWPGLVATPRLVAEGIKDKAFRRILKDLAPLVAAGLLNADDDIEDAIRAAYDFGPMAETMRGRDRTARARRLQAGAGSRNAPGVAAPPGVPIKENTSGSLPGDDSGGGTPGPAP